jgi:hypothetical protein
MSDTGLVSSALSEPTGTGIAPPVKPSVWKVGWATLVGYFLTVVLGLPIAFALLYIGVDVYGNDTTGRGVFHAHDVWGWLAEGSLGLLATWATAVLVGTSLRDRTGWEVPFGFTFLTLLVTGYAPLLALTPFYWATAPVSLVAATLILRLRCEPCGAEPRGALAAVPRRHRRAVAIGLAVGGPLLFAYVLAYGSLHPLEAEFWGDPPRTLQHQPGKLSRFNVEIENRGPFAVTDASIVRLEGSPVLQLERAGFEGGECTVPKGQETCEAPLRTVRSFRAGQTITLELRQGRLCPPGIAGLDAIWLRYTILDTRQEQRLQLRHSPRVRCP